MRDHNYFVYILASGRNGTLYVGVTNSLDRRVGQHREGSAASFTKKYHVTRLVWFRHFEDIHVAIHREKQLKRWRRSWKIALIEAENPQWLDLLNNPKGCHPGRSEAESRDPGDRIEQDRCNDTALQSLGPGSAR